MVRRLRGTFSGAAMKDRASLKAAEMGSSLSRWLGACDTSALPAGVSRYVFWEAPYFASPFATKFFSVASTIP
ncbi:hypothetical protein GCM10019059_39210 [Camelimonas fluminis]|nr:hypothetical protein GCM10019059_39210 [Camelimonas fluminis]